ncbi:MAG: hypothetical protein ACI8WB_000196 [Phenylobacterium sp.]|jgi:hypothetical protein
MKIKLILPLLMFTLPLLAKAAGEPMLTGKWALNQTPVTAIAEKSIKVRMTDEDVVALYDRFAEHYGDFMTGAKTREVDFEFLMTEQNSKTAFQLHYLLELAVNKGLTMTAFADFGLIQNKKGNVHYDMEVSPHLASPYLLFSSLSDEGRMSFVTKDLINQGFRRNDIAIINAHWQQNDIKEIIGRQVFILTKQDLPIRKQIISFDPKLDDDDVIDYFQLSDYKRKYINHHAWRNWGLTLLAKLDPQRQQMLKDFLVESQSASGGMSPLSKEDIKRFIAMWAKESSPEQLEQEVKELSKKYNMEDL